MSAPPFVAVWRRALIDCGLDPTAFAVAVVMAECGDYDTGANVRPSYGYISRALGGLSDDAIGRATKRLQDAGVLVQVKRGGRGRAALWRLVIPAEHPASERGDDLWTTDEHPAQHTAPERGDDPTPRATPRTTPRASAVLPGTRDQNPPTPAQRYVQSPLANPTTGGREADREGTGKDTRDVIALLHPSRQEAVRDSHPFRTATGALIAAGWTPEQVAADVNSRSTAGAVSVGAVLVGHVRNLVRDQAQPAAAPLPPLPRIAWCGDCESDDYRWIEDDAGRASKCTRCHPSVALAVAVSA